MTIIFKSNIVGIIRYIYCGIYKYIKKIYNNKSNGKQIL